MSGQPGTNTGHGHVWPRPDGVKAKCGGPGICAECSKDLGAKATPAKARPMSDPTTAETPTKRERLARAAHGGSTHSEAPEFPWDDAPDWMKSDYRAMVDAILREMLEPSTTYCAMGKCPIHTAVSAKAKGPEMLQDLDPEEIAQIRIWLIQHILNETQD